jgi:hypothetical protein
MPRYTIAHTTIAQICLDYNTAVQCDSDFEEPIYINDTLVKACEWESIIEGPFFHFFELHWTEGALCKLLFAFVIVNL